MKKFFAIILTIILFFSITNFSLANSRKELQKIVEIAGYRTNYKEHPKSAILINVDSDDIIFEKDAKLKLDPASITKVLTIYIVFEEIEKGNLSFDTKIKATDIDEKISNLKTLSNNKIYKNIEYSVDDLIKMSLVASSNVATIMLENKISNNNPDSFIDKLNVKAQELGMKDSYFYNSTGAEAVAFNGLYKIKKYDENKTNISTAYDLAILIQKILKKFPKITEYTSKEKIKVMDNTPYEDTLNNHNYSLPNLKYGFIGVDGVKTGSSPNAGFNVAVSAKQNNTHLVAIVLGVGNWYNRTDEYNRHKFINGLLNYGFYNFEEKIILHKGLNKINNKEFILSENYKTLVNKNINEENYKFKIEENKGDNNFVITLTDAPKKINSENKENNILAIEGTFFNKAKEKITNLFNDNKILAIVFLIIISLLITKIIKSIKKLI